ncbi:hypothetical protein GGTG_13541 [Gaeumannomyces tritici R3-111a-1]|uniref:Uncharacterized protein n=1 Tax=Gaeumannomyces tritici (strain R3-111a-1) TaxID=644352 RepID=J3PJ59_GAET3|nr:hypothetical protein GGTG_13541 [Gaeumannomyces tritici R3-111a-1]EJT68877.1 hypothetical protein GGTG_13541 [Gaeumannomyces tritici R3-111a-1]
MPRPPQQRLQEQSAKASKKARQLQEKVKENGFHFSPRGDHTKFVIEWARVRYDGKTGPKQALRLDVGCALQTASGTVKFLENAEDAEVLTKFRADANALFVRLDINSCFRYLSALVEPEPELAACFLIELATQYTKYFEKCVKLVPGLAGSLDHNTANRHEAGSPSSPPSPFAPDQSSSAAHASTHPPPPTSTQNDPAPLPPPKRQQPQAGNPARRQRVLSHAASPPSTEPAGLLADQPPPSSGPSSPPTQSAALFSDGAKTPSLPTSTTTFAPVPDHPPHTPNSPSLPVAPPALAARPKDTANGTTSAPDIQLDGSHLFPGSNLPPSSSLPNPTAAPQVRPDDATTSATIQTKKRKAANVSVQTKRPRRRPRKQDVAAISAPSRMAPSAETETCPPTASIGAASFNGAQANQQPTPPPPIQSAAASPDTNAAPKHPSARTEPPSLRTPTLNSTPSQGSSPFAHSNQPPAGERENAGNSGAPSPGNTTTRYGPAPPPAVETLQLAEQVRVGAASQGLGDCHQPSRPPHPTPGPIQLAPQLPDNTSPASSTGPSPSSPNPDKVHRFTGYLLSAADEFFTEECIKMLAPQGIVGQPRRGQSINATLEHGVLTLGIRLRNDRPDFNLQEAHLKGKLLTAVKWWQFENEKASIIRETHGILIRVHFGGAGYLVAKALFFHDEDMQES